MTTPANTAQIPDGSPLAHPFYQVDATGKPIGSSNGLSVLTEVDMSAKAGAIALVSPPTQTNAGSDTPLTFTQQVAHFLIQNNTSANCYIDLDATASTSTIALPPGTLWRDDIQVTVLHVYTAAAQNVNGGTGIVVRGWL